MKQTIITAVLPFVISLAATAIILPLLIKWSPVLRLVDQPNERKVHRTPIPAIGGLVIMLSLFVTAIFSEELQTLLKAHPALSVSALIMSATGVLDDRINLPARLRFAIQIACAAAIAYSGIRLQSLHGLFGINELPVAVQYLLTILIIAGVTNAFNLIDGIDGLAGSFALINLLTLCAVSISMGKTNWLFLLLPLMGSLLVFLKYNWRPAKVFLGDGGSLVFGFLMPVVGIALMKPDMPNPAGIQPGTLAVIVTAYCMIPVMDTLRVFYDRVRRGRSPFSADKNHLHHWLIRHHLVHSQATGRLILFHLTLIGLSTVAIYFMQATWVLFGQVLAVILYTKWLQLSSYFYRWYRFIKRMESATVGD